MSTIAATNLKNPSSGSNNIVLNTDGTTTIAAPSNIIKSGTAVASTSGTSIDFTGIPSWVKRVTVMFDGVSTSGTSSYLIQLGDTGGAETTGYISYGTRFGTSTLASSASTAGFIINQFTAAQVLQGSVIVANLNQNTWVAQGLLTTSTSGTPDNLCAASGSKTLSATLDRIRITTVNGTDTFDAGSINILYEG
jgi:hypothetical protein